MIPILDKYNFFFKIIPQMFEKLLASINELFLLLISHNIIFIYVCYFSKKQRGCGTFLVDPTLHVGKLDERLPLDAVTCQTVLSKSLGKFKDWEER